MFVDTFTGVEHGPGAGRGDELLREADLLVNLSGVNAIPLDGRAGRPAAYVDLDPGVTQLNLANGDKALRDILDAHVTLFTFGENIGTPRSPIPTGGYTWHATRQPVVIELWELAGVPRSVYTTVGKWLSHGRDISTGASAIG